MSAQTPTVREIDHMRGHDILETEAQIKSVYGLGSENNHQNINEFYNTLSQFVAPFFEITTFLEIEKDLDTSLYRRGDDNSDISELSDQFVEDLEQVQEDLTWNEKESPTEIIEGELESDSKHSDHYKEEEPVESIVNFLQTDVDKRLEEMRDSYEDLSEESNGTKQGSTIDPVRALRDTQLFYESMNQMLKAYDSGEVPENSEMLSEKQMVEIYSGDEDLDVEVYKNGEKVTVDQLEENGITEKAVAAALITQKNNTKEEVSFDEKAELNIYIEENEGDYDFTIQDSDGGISPEEFNYSPPIKHLLAEGNVNTNSLLDAKLSEEPGFDQETGYKSGFGCYISNKIAEMAEGEWDYIGESVETDYDKRELSGAAFRYSFRQENQEDEKSISMAAAN